MQNCSESNIRKFSETFFPEAALGWYREKRSLSVPLSTETNHTYSGFICAALAWSQNSNVSRKQSVRKNPPTRKSRCQPLRSASQNRLACEQRKSPFLQSRQNGATFIFSFRNP